MDLSKLTLISLKGEGYFCIVKKLQSSEDSNYYALKELKKKFYTNGDYRYRFNREVELLKRLEGTENIISLKTHGENIPKQALWYIMPFADFTLYDYIKRNNNNLEKTIRYKIVSEIIAGLKYAHNLGIIHRDLSPNNVLIFLGEDGIPVIKISDFGLGKDKESLSHYSNSGASGYGQILYVSPEQRSKLKDATIRSDIYSLGKLIYFVFTGKDPVKIEGCELGTLITKATEESPEARYMNIEELEQHFNSLMSLNLDNKIPNAFITVREVLNAESELDLIMLHEVFVKGNYIDWTSSQ